jgi:hypothetical protein
MTVTWYPVLDEAAGPFGGHTHGDWDAPASPADRQEWHEWMVVESCREIAKVLELVGSPEIRRDHGFTRWDEQSQSWCRLGS